MFNPAYAQYLSQHKMNENMAYVRQAQLLRALREGNTRPHNIGRSFFSLLQSLWPFNQPRALSAAQ